MFRVSRILFLLIILGAIWFFWPFGKYDDEVAVAPPQAGDGQQDQLFTKPLSNDAASDAETGDRGSTATETIADSTNQDGGAVTRDGDTRQTEQSAPGGQPKRFYRVVVKDGGSFQAGNTTVTLAGVEVEGLTGECEDSRGQAWPCGRSARSALTRLIRGRAVTCVVPATHEAGDVAARCSVGGKDLSFWMVAQGWAKPKQPAQAAFKEAEDAARERRLGIWR